MVSSANPHASRAALAVLRDGGSAADAAIAAQWVLGLVEPQSSGLGGGTFILHHSSSGRRTIAIDGRETAPLDVNERLFLDSTGKPVSFVQAVVGGRSVGAPGTVAAMWRLHEVAGRLPWSRLFDAAIELAEHGFEVSPRLHSLLAGESWLKRDPAARTYFYDDRGQPWAVGHRLQNPQYAGVLRRLAAEGPTAFYHGALAAAIVEKVQRHPDNPGRLTAADLAAYRAIVREPVCGPYLRYRVCGMPPPSSGGITVLQMLSMLEARTHSGVRPLLSGRQLDLDGAHRFLESARLAYADRGEYLADPDFVDWPRGLIAGDYLRARALLIDENRAQTRVDPGRPDRSNLPLPRSRAALEYPESGTSHWSVADRDGNVVAVTSTIESAFGSRQMVAGFLLNNQLTDFAILPREHERPLANRVEPGKRPRSSMAPTLVFDREPAGGSGAWVVSVGSPGGSQIINYVAKVLVAVLADGLDIQSAIDAPNLANRGGPSEFEVGRIDERVANALRARGHEVRTADMTSGLHGVVRRCPRSTPDPSCILFGGADPRREGLALGD